jgi:hypothetical protein
MAALPYKRLVCRPALRELPSMSKPTVPRSEDLRRENAIGSSMRLSACP